MLRRLVPDVRWAVPAARDALLRRARDAPARVRAAPAAVRDPSVQTDLLQLVKAVVAAVAAWLLADAVLGLPQAFLAPWSALLTVHATVYRSLARGAQAVMATVLGVLLAAAAVQAMGPGAVTLAVAMLVGLLLARVGLLRDEGVTVATTALFVLTADSAGSDPVLLGRVLDVAVGIGTGVLVNLVVLPPLNDASAARWVDRIDARLGGLLVDMATELGETWTTEHSGRWIERTRDLDDLLDQAWQVVRTAQEGSRMNPRRRWSPHARDTAGYADVLRRLEEGVAEVRSMARTVHEATTSAQEWDAGFREPWLEALEQTGRRVAEPDADVSGVRTSLDDLTRRLSVQDLHARHWPVYGALITSLRNVVDVVDDVATAQPVRT